MADPGVQAVREWLQCQPFSLRIVTLILFMRVMFNTKTRRPLVDGTPLRAAEDYGDFKTHPQSHLEAWSLRCGVS
jgi:hypothetical protein